LAVFFGVGVGAAAATAAVWRLLLVGIPEEAVTMTQGKLESCRGKTKTSGGRMRPIVGQGAQPALAGNPGTGTATTGVKKSQMLGKRAPYQKEQTCMLCLVWMKAAMVVVGGPSQSRRGKWSVVALL
jgi:hypothetical protein